MTAQAIVDMVKHGAIITVSRNNAFTFMRECERHDINCRLSIKFRGRVATIEDPLLKREAAK